MGRAGAGEASSSSNMTRSDGWTPETASDAMTPCPDNPLFWLCGCVPSLLGLPTRKATAPSSQSQSNTIQRLATTPLPTARKPALTTMASVDDLLDELDDLLSEPPASSSKKPQPPKPSTPPKYSSAAKANRATDDLDALLADIDGPGPRVQKQPAAPASAPSRSAAAVGAFPGGSDDTATRMRCSKCDHKVLRFVEKQWAADADYMFFRNFMPNVDKLSAKLKPKDGYCAFSCQCQWTTVELGAPHGVSSWFATRNLD